MDHFLYHEGILHAEDVAIPEIAQAISTPFYVYSTATLERHYRLFEEALSGLDHLIAFAVKANSNQAVLATLAQLGSGMDVVSLGEYRRAIAAGVPTERIVFSGVGKSHAEISEVISKGVHHINVESWPELRRLSSLANGLSQPVNIAMRLNPDVDAKTHAKIATGKAENKFGIPVTQALNMAEEIARHPNLKLVGVDVHIGSQLTDLTPYRQAFERIASITKELRNSGHEISRVDLGGGLGIPYSRGNALPPPPLEYGALVREIIGPLGCEVVIEPGRLIAGNAGLLVSRVEYVKLGEERKFLILDAAMNDLIRPAMYDAWHDIVPINEFPPGTELSAYDVVGPVCETGDTFARSRDLPGFEEGDLVAFRSAGAYSSVMASEYNTRPLIPEIIVSGDAFSVARARPSLDEIIARDRIPPWLVGT